MDLTNAQWALIEPLIPVKPRRADGKGRPPTPPRPLLNAMLWVDRTGAPWADMPTRYPPYQTVHRWFQKWTRDGTFEKIQKALAEDLAERGKIDVTEAFIDGSFAAAKKGAIVLELPSAAKAQRSWSSQTAMALLSRLASTAPRRTK
jgi:transposase